jgi:nitrogen fixation NifU-like protein
MFQDSDMSRETPNLGELYQEVIVEHSRRPRCKGRLDGCQFCLEGKNPLCGDNITLFCQLLPDRGSQTEPRIRVQFEGSGCSISQASTSMMCDSVANRTVSEVRSLIARVEGIYTGRTQISSEEDLEEDVEALQGVSKFPVRIKCAALPWKTLELLINENFDENGLQRPESLACKVDEPCGAQKRKLKVITTE